MSRPAIVTTGVSKSFRRHHRDRPWTVQEVLAKGFRRFRDVDRMWALRDVNFKVDQGRTVGIIGANGSGKSTLLRLTGGVGRPDSGTIALGGRVNALLDLGAGFHPDLTGRENAIMSGVISGLSRRQVLARLEAIVAFAEIEAFIDYPMRTYSTGMQMRLAFAAAVHADPEILLIDEVLSVGDLAFQRKCLDRINQFKAAGCSILLVTHEASVVQELCDEAIWLNAGRLMVHGPAIDVVQRYMGHMAGETARVDPGADVSRPEVLAPQAAVTTDQGAKVLIDENRFGSLELRMTEVRTLDLDGRPITEIQSGQALQIEIGYFAARLVVAPLLRIRLLRDDGLLCCDFTTDKSVLSVTGLHGEGRLRLGIDRLDLSDGRYTIDVGCYAQDWAYAYDYRSSIPVTVRGESATKGVLSVPHFWQIDGVERETLVTPKDAQAQER